MKNLPKITSGKNKRVGRGYGSGKGGHTSGRGTKGQKSRGDIPIIFEGTKIKKSYIKRLPFMRGKGKFKSFSKEVKIINLNDLADWPKDTTVNPESLVKSGKIKAGFMVKILGSGEVKIALKFENISMSESARKKIIASGGQIL